MSGTGTRRSALAARIRHGYHRRMLLFVCFLIVGLMTACGSSATVVSQTVEPTRLPDVAHTKMPDASPSPTQTPVPAETPRPELDPTEQPSTRPLETPQEIVGPVVTVGGTSLPVDLAITVEEQVQGLSGRAILAPGSGMLFVYAQARKFTFWMKDMRFPLDIVWIGADCRVVEVKENVPSPRPGQSDEELPRYSPGTPAQYVLEINAGEAAFQNISPGDPVEFTGSLAGRYGC